MSIRGLYAGFQHDLQTSPMGYFRTARLSAAHDEFVDADPEQITVEAVAARWGFLDSRRFVERYRATYREHPAEVPALRRAP